MRREQAIEKIRRVERELRALGVGGAALFGSVARGDNSQMSDIDIALSPASGMPVSALTLLSIHGVLGDEFGYVAPLDVVVLPARDPGLNAAIDREGVRAF